MKVVVRKWGNSAAVRIPAVRLTASMSWFAASLLKTSTRTSISNPGQSGFDTDSCETGALAQLALPHVQKPARTFQRRS